MLGRVNRIHLRYVTGVILDRGTTDKKTGLYNTARYGKSGWEPSPGDSCARVEKKTMKSNQIKAISVASVYLALDTMYSMLETISL